MWFHVAGIALAWFLYERRTETPSRIVSAVPWAHRLIYNKYYVDEIYDVLIVKPIMVISNILHRVVDEFLIEVSGHSPQLVAEVRAILDVQSGKVPPD